MEDYNPSTRSTSNNARGHKRRIGSSKQSSVDPDVPVERKTKKTKSDESDPASISCLPTLPGAGSFFQNQKAGSKGMRVKIQTALCSGEVMQVSDEDYRTFYDSTRYNDPSRVFVAETLKHHEKNNEGTAWTLLSDCNVLMFGLGSKKKVIQDLVSNWLDGEDVIEINGSGNGSTTASSGEKYIKALMSHINRTVLKNKWALEGCTTNLVQQAKLLSELLNLHYGRGSSSTTMSTESLRPSKSDPSLPLFSGLEEDDASMGIAVRKQSRQSVHDQERWGGRYALAKSKLYLIVHNICGDALSSPLSQECLSLLASCKSVAVLATVENLNSVAHWDRRVLARYNWSYRHTPTFEPARIPSNSFPLVSGELNGLEVEVAEGDETMHVSEIDGNAVDKNDDYFQPQAESEDVSTTSVSAKSPGRPKKTDTSIATSKKNKNAQMDQLAPPAASAKSKATKASTNSSSKASGNAPQRVTAAEVAPSRAAVSLAAIKKSVTGNHNTVLEALVNAVLKKTAKLDKQREAEAHGSSTVVRPKSAITTRPQHETGVPFRAFYNSLKGSLVVKSDTMLRDLLKEFVDHAVIGYMFHENEEFVYFKYPYTIHLQNDFVDKVMTIVKK